MPQSPPRPIPVTLHEERRSRGEDALHVRADYSSYRKANHAGGRLAAVELTLAPGGDYLELFGYYGRHPYEWATFSPSCLPTGEEFMESLFPPRVPESAALAAWREMFRLLRPHLDREVLRLTLQVEGSIRLYNALHRDAGRRELARAFPVAAALLEYHRVFHRRASESLEQSFWRLVRESLPVVRSYRPWGRDVELPTRAPAAFLAWARRARWRTGHIPFLATQDSGASADGIFHIARACSGIKEEALHRFSTPAHLLVFGEAAIRAQLEETPGLFSLVLRDPEGALRLCRERAAEQERQYRESSPFPHVVAGTLGELGSAFRELRRVNFRELSVAELGALHQEHRERIRERHRRQTAREFRQAIEQARENPLRFPTPAVVEAEEEGLRLEFLADSLSLLEAAREDGDRSILRLLPEVEAGKRRYYRLSRTKTGRTVSLVLVDEGYSVALAHGASERARRWMERLFQPHAVPEKQGGTESDGWRLFSRLRREMKEEKAGEAD